MTFDLRDYPPDWRWIVRQIRDQANNCCEFCGIANGAVTVRATRVVLTTAHLDHDTSNNDPANLRALCQSDHLAWDRDHHIATGHQTRRQRRIARGQLTLTGETP